MRPAGRGLAMAALYDLKFSMGVRSKLPECDKTRDDDEFPMMALRVEDLSDLRDRGPGFINIHSRRQSLISCCPKEK
jgi:hypothetical protein